jgi:hypothetical protein
VYDILPLRSFKLHLDYSQALGRNLWWRAGEQRWREGAQFDERAPGSLVGSPVYQGAIQFADALSSDLDAAVHEWKKWLEQVGQAANADVRWAALTQSLKMSGVDRKRMETTEHATQQVAAAVGGMFHEPFQREAAVADVIDPQMIVEALLSREWGNKNLDSKCQRKQDKLTRQLGAGLVLATTDDERRDVAHQFFTSQLDGVKQRRREGVEQMTALLEKLDRAAVQAARAATPGNATAGEHAIWALMLTGGDTPAMSMGLMIIQDHIVKLARAHTTTSGDHEVVDWPGFYKDVAAYLRLEIVPIQAFETLRELARALAQKPDFCVPRFTFGSTDDLERLFPLSLSWDWRWFMGAAARLER